MFSNIKLALAASAVAAAVAAIGLLTWQNSGLRSEVETLAAEKGALTVAVEVQRATIEAAAANAEEWQKTADKFGARLVQLEEVQSNANAQVTRLNDIFARHDLGALLQARPGLIERRINSGTDDTLRMLECASDPGRCDAPEPAGPAGETGAP